MLVLIGNDRITHKDMKEKILQMLNNLGIIYQLLEHAPIMTMEEGLSIAKQLDVKPCKNLFLVDKQGQHYLLLLDGGKKFKAKIVSNQIGCSHLSFGNPEDLRALLGTQPGAVSILGLANDTGNKVRLLIDKDVLAEEYIGCHPCSNAASVKLKVSDLVKVLLPNIGHPTFEMVEI